MLSCNQELSCISWCWLLRCKPMLLVSNDLLDLSFDFLKPRSEGRFCLNIASSKFIDVTNVAVEKFVAFIDIPLHGAQGRVIRCRL